MVLYKIVIRQAHTIIRLESHIYCSYTSNDSCLVCIEIYTYFKMYVIYPRYIIFTIYLLIVVAIWMCCLDTLFIIKKKGVRVAKLSACD